MCPPRKGSGRCPSRSRRREAGSSARADPCGAPLPTVVAAAADGDGYGCQPPCGLHAVGAVRESPPAGETPSARCGVAEEKRMEIERQRCVTKCRKATGRGNAWSCVDPTRGWVGEKWEAGRFGEIKYGGLYTSHYQVILKQGRAFSGRTGGLRARRGSHARGGTVGAMLWVACSGAPCPRSIYSPMCGRPEERSCPSAAGRSRIWTCCAWQEARLAGSAQPAGILGSCLYSTKYSLQKPRQKIYFLHLKIIAHLEFKICLTKKYYFDLTTTKKNKSFRRLLTKEIRHYINTSHKKQKVF